MTNNDLQQASAWTRNYRNQHPTGIKAHCLTAETLQSILSQKNCVGVRAYYGLDDADQPQLVLVGYDADDHDILPNPVPVEAESMTAKRSVEEIESAVSVSTNHQPCPPCCSLENILNS